MPKRKVDEEPDMKTLLKDFGQNAKEVIGSELNLLVAEARHAGKLGTLVLPMLPVLKKVGVKAVRSVRAAPVPYIWIAAGIAGYVAFKYYQNHKELKKNFS